MHKEDADQMFFESNNKAQVMERGIVRVHQQVEQIEVRIALYTIVVFR
jgi:hypothetical protein